MMKLNKMYIKILMILTMSIWSMITILKIPHLIKQKMTTEIELWYSAVEVGITATLSQITNSSYKARVSWAAGGQTVKAKA